MQRAGQGQVADRGIARALLDEAAAVLAAEMQHAGERQCLHGAEQEFRQGQLVGRAREQGHRAPAPGDGIPADADRALFHHHVEGQCEQERIPQQRRLTDAGQALAQDMHEGTDQLHAGEHPEDVAVEGNEGFKHVFRVLRHPARYFGGPRSHVPEMGVVGHPGLRVGEQQVLEPHRRQCQAKQALGGERTAAQARPQCVVPQTGQCRQQAADLQQQQNPVLPLRQRIGPRIDRTEMRRRRPAHPAPGGHGEEACADPGEGAGKAGSGLRRRAEWIRCGGGHAGRHLVRLGRGHLYV